MELSHFPTEGPIPLTTSGRHRRMDSARECVVERDREVERGASNPREDDTKGNGRERLSPRDGQASAVSGKNHRLLDMKLVSH